MTENLKITVTFTKTYNLGNYESLKIGVSKEYYQGEFSYDDAFTDLELQVEMARAKATRL